MKVIGASSVEFEIPDQRIKDCPRYDSEGFPIKNTVTYMFEHVLDRLMGDLSREDLHRNSKVNLQLSVINDGVKDGIYHKVIGRIEIE